MKNSFVPFKPQLYAAGEIVNAVYKYFRGYYKDTKRDLTEGVSFFKEELSGAFGKTTDCINNLAMPINNFLKDAAEIESDFKKELQEDKEYCICLDGKMVPVSKILRQPMEENY